MGRHTNFVMSSLNSQYAASIVSGSAQTPLVQVLPSTLGRPRYRKFPTAMATRYGGMGMGYSGFIKGCDSSWVIMSTDLLVLVGDPILANFLPVVSGAI